MRSSGGLTQATANSRSLRALPLPLPRSSFSICCSSRHAHHSDSLMGFSLLLDLGEATRTVVAEQASEGNSGREPVSRPERRIGPAECLPARCRLPLPPASPEALAWRGSAAHGRRRKEG